MIGARLLSSCSIPATGMGAFGASLASEATCIRGLQLYLVNQQSLSYAFATGTWNPETEAALSSRFPNPRAYPGGPCTMLTLLGVQPSGVPPRSGMNFPRIDSVSPGAIAIAGAAIIGLLVIVMKGRGV